MANRFHAENKWVENLRLAYVKHEYRATSDYHKETLCHEVKSFWIGDVEEVCGDFPEEQKDEPIASDAKSATWWRVAGSIVRGILVAIKEPSESENIKRYPSVRFRDGNVYYIDDKSEYNRFMGIMKET